MKKSYAYDVFISHAYEDKSVISDEITKRLRDSGIKVWYSGTDMRVGQSLKKIIVEGAIHKSKFGIVIISNNLFKATWARREVNYMNALEDKRGYNMILPIWHNVNDDEVQREFPYLMDCFAVNTKIGLDEVTRKLIEEVKKEMPPPVKTPTIVISSQYHRWIMVLAIGIITLFIGNYFLSKTPKGPSEKAVRKILQDYTTAFQSQIIAEYTKKLHETHALYVEFDTIKSIYSSFTKNHLCNRNEYKLVTNSKEIKGRKKIELAGINTKAFYTSFGINQLAPYMAEKSSKEKTYSFMLINKEDITFHVDNITMINDFQANVRVQYINPLRYVDMEVFCENDKQPCSKQVITYYGFNKYHNYLFERNGKFWNLLATVHP